MTQDKERAPGLGALLDSRLLQFFDLLYRTRSVSRCADLLGQAQPTVSIWLGRLRRELNDPLFVRTGRGLEPTPRADALITTARSAIDLLQRLAEMEGDFDPSRSRRRFRICLTDASHMTLMPTVLRRLQEEGSDLRVTALQIDADTGRKLASGEADLALGLVPDLDSGFYQQILYTQDWVCIANAEHPTFTSEGMCRDDYEQAGHVDVSRGTGYHLLHQALAMAKINRRVMVEIPGFLGLSAILRATDLLATVPRHTGGMLAQAGGLRVLPCPFPIPTFEVKQYWHERYHHDSGNRWLRNVCADLFQQGTGHILGVS